MSIIPVITCLKIINFAYPTYPTLTGLLWVIVGEVLFPYHRLRCSVCDDFSAVPILSTDKTNSHNHIKQANVVAVGAVTKSINVTQTYNFLPITKLRCCRFHAVIVHIHNHKPIYPCRRIFRSSVQNKHQRMCQFALSPQS